MTVPNKLCLILASVGMWLAIMPSLSAVEPVLRWGGDQEGGGPYIYSPDDDPTRIIGFEVDFAAALARHMGMRAEFVQCKWEQILPELHRGDIDVGLNGIEFTSERAAQYLSSIPYYVYELALCARRNHAELTGWDSLRRTAEGNRKWRIGVLEASAADRYVSDQFSETCEIFRYEGSTESLRLVETEQLDATVQDLPILQFYIEQLQRYPSLHLIGKPTAAGYYVLYAKHGDRNLIDTINRAIRTMYENGELKTIYERYGVWNATQETLPDVWTTWHNKLTEHTPDKWLSLSLQIPLLLRAAGVTVLLAGLSMPLAVMIGLVVALVRSWSSPALGGTGLAEGWNRFVRTPFSLYVELVRGTPLAFQLFVVFFVLPEFHIKLSAFWAGVMALAVNYSAYEAEIFRLGLQAIPRGQIEAALSLGMPRGLAVRRIILPQAVRIVIPATANDFIALFKDTAVCSVIAVEELSKQYSMGAKSTGLFLEMAALASVLYLVMSYPLSRLAAWLERRLGTRSAV